PCCPGMVDIRSSLEYDKHSFQYALVDREDHFESAMVCFHYIVLCLDGDNRFLKNRITFSTTDQRDLVGRSEEISIIDHTLFDQFVELIDHNDLMLKILFLHRDQSFD